MSLIVDAIQPHIPRALLGFAGIAACGLEDAIARQPYSLGVDPTRQCIRLDFRDPQRAGEIFATDASRLASAAFQTVLTIERDGSDPDAVSWRLIKLYYSAFYSAHALMRYLGRAFSYVSTTSTTRIANLISVIGGTSPIALGGGQYEATLDVTAVCLLQPPAAKHGAHEGFWRVFGAVLGDLGSEILCGPLPRADAQNATATLDNLRDVLRKQAKSGAWLSFVRNELQYRHGMGVWFPFRAKKQACSYIDRAVRRWTTDPMSIPLSPQQTDLEDFVSACVFLIALCRCTTLQIETRSPVRCSFVGYGPVKYLRQSRRA